MTSIHKRWNPGTHVCEVQHGDTERREISDGLLQVRSLSIPNRAGKGLFHSEPIRNNTDGRLTAKPAGVTK